MPKFTKSGKPTAVGDVEGKLKREYPNDPGAVYGTLNKIGLMRGNKTTAKGKKAAKSPTRGPSHEGGGQGAIATHPSMSGTGMFDTHHKRKF